VIEESKVKYGDKEDLAKFNFKAKRVSVQLFANSQKYLQKLKDIKKMYALGTGKEGSGKGKEETCE
jgi:hypothetical protein